MKIIGERTKVSGLNFVKPDVYSKLRKLYIYFGVNIGGGVEGGEMSPIGVYVSRNEGHARITIGILLDAKMTLIVIIMNASINLTFFL